MAENGKLANRIGSAAEKLVVDAEVALRSAKLRSQDEITGGKNLLLLIAAASLIVAFAIAWLYVGRRVVRRLMVPQKSMLAIADDNLEASIPQGGKDEIADMVRALATLRDNGLAARRVQQQVSDERKLTAETRHRELQELAESFQGTVLRVVGSVSNAAGEMRATAESMVTAAGIANLQANAVADASAEASGNVHTVAAAARELTASTVAISQQVNQSVHFTGTAVNEAHDTNDLVQGLMGAAQKIGIVVQLISDIASQTNLLALNATIEAARGSRLSPPRSKASPARRHARPKRSRRRLPTCRIQPATPIQNIGCTIKQISEIATAIAGAVEQQNATTVEMASNFQRAASLTSDVTQTIAVVREATGETGTAANHVLCNATELARDADRLLTEVDRFLARVKAA